jgi:hypothetical protein
MFTLTAIDPRLALLALAALLLGAAVPLGYAWARLIPEEAPPFPIEPGSFPAIDQQVPDDESTRPRRDFAALALLFCMTVAYAIRFPVFPAALFTNWLATIVSGQTEYWILLGGQILLIGATAASGIYAAVRFKSPRLRFLRIPLIAGAALVLILWFLAPLLEAALVATS